MPVCRHKLTPAERTARLCLAEQLRASGVEIEISEEWRENSRSVDIVVGGPAESTVIEFASGLVG
jgi:hypothetical protein